VTHYHSNFFARPIDISRKLFKNVAANIALSLFNEKKAQFFDRLKSKHDQNWRCSIFAQIF
jgi:hypothetical protein